MKRLYDDLLKDNKIYLELCEKLYNYARPLKDYMKDGNNDFIITMSRISLKKDEEISNRQIHDFYFGSSKGFASVLREVLITCDSDMRNCVEAYKDFFIAYDIYVEILDVNKIKINSLETITRGIAIISKYPIRIHLFSSIDNYVSYTFLNKEENAPLNIPIILGLPQRIAEGIKYLEEHDKDNFDYDSFCRLSQLVFQTYGKNEYVDKIYTDYKKVLNADTPLCSVLCSGIDKYVRHIDYKYEYKKDNKNKLISIPEEFNTGKIFVINIIFNDKFFKLDDLGNLLYIIDNFITYIYKYHNNDFIRIMMFIPKSYKDFEFHEFFTTDDTQHFKDVPIDHIKEINDTLYSRIGRYIFNLICIYNMKKFHRDDELI